MEQKIIGYADGITRTPSDFAAPDGGLAECVNLEVKNGELYPIEMPVPTGYRLIQGSTLMHVHHTADGGKYYITVRRNPENMKYHVSCFSATPVEGNTTDSVGSVILNDEPTHITSIGNTLMVVTPEEVQYLLYKGRRYYNIGGKMPETVISFNITTETKVTDAVGVEPIGDGGNPSSEFEMPENVAAHLNTYILSTVNEMTEQAKKDRRFVYPFFVRYAYRLFDGSYTMQSAPILIVPNNGPAPSAGLHYIYANVSGKGLYSDIYYKVACMQSTLFANIANLPWQLSDWADIIKSVDFFITRPVPTRYQDGELVENLLVPAYQSGQVNSISFCTNTRPDSASGFIRFNGFPQWGDGRLAYTPQYRLKDTVEQELQASSVFYKVHSLSVESLTGMGPVASGKSIDILKEAGNQNILLHLEQQPTLDDDYHTHDTLLPAYVDNYNRRINMANLRRKFFRGFSPAALRTYGTQRPEDTCQIYTYIKGVSGEVAVATERAVRTSLAKPNYLFYPDANAYKMVIRNGDACAEYPLTQHPALNGAYFMDFAGEFEPESVGTPQETELQTEELPNKLYTSAIGNPFHFPLKGIVTVGVGKILGIAATTVPISQGQFGQYPMLAFCSEGNYALSVDEEGYYRSVSPIQEDTVLSHRQITKREGSVLAITKKGIMETNGGQMVLLTAKMDGAHFDAGVLPGVSTGVGAYGYLLSASSDADGFLSYLYGARMAYDYSSNRMFIYNKEKAYAYVMNLESNTFAKFVLPDGGRIVGHVLDYPDTIIQTDAGELLSLYEKEDVNAIYERRYGVLISRPMTLGAPLELKSMQRITNMGSLHSGSRARYHLYGSNDGEHYNLIASRYGKPYKFFRIAIYIEALPREALSGTSFIFDRRRTHRPR